MSEKIANKISRLVNDKLSKEMDFVLNSIKYIDINYKKNITLVGWSSSGKSTIKKNLFRNNNSVEEVNLSSYEHRPDNFVIFLLPHDFNPDLTENLANQIKDMTAVLFMGKPSNHQLFNFYYFSNLPTIGYWHNNNLEKFINKTNQEKEAIKEDENMITMDNLKQMFETIINIDTTTFKNNSLKNSMNKMDKNSIRKYVGIINNMSKEQKEKFDKLKKIELKREEKVVLIKGIEGCKTSHVEDLIKMYNLYQQKSNLFKK